MATVRVRLTDLELGETGIIGEISLPEDGQQFLMRFGFFPDTEVKFSRRSPLGDPNIYSIDGAEVALRAETACQIFVSRASHLRTSEGP